MFTSLFKPSIAHHLENTIRPGSRYGLYPEKLPQLFISNTARLEKWLARHIENLFCAATVGSKKQRRFIRQVDKLGMTLAKKSDASLDQLIHKVRTHLRSRGITESATIIAFATIREVSRRLLGMPHHEVQLLGGRCILYGAIAEMQTGEGKTLTAVLPACTAAMAGIPVHVVTVNDYLAKRDAESMQAIYQHFGLSLGVIQAGMDPEQRRAAYACDITYCSNKQLAFDYLKDGLLLKGHEDRLSLTLLSLIDKRFDQNQLLLRGLNFAIVDEADSIFIDEARTPLILSRTSDVSDSEQTERVFYQQALSITEELRDYLDFTVDYKAREITLTTAGLNHIDQECDDLGGHWNRQRQRKIFILLALNARYLYNKDRHYLIHHDAVHIIDEQTGRIMVDQTWEYGLQQMIEAKEGCELTPKRETLTQVSYQHFFQRYWRLGGMTGTGQECKSELNLVYGLKVVTIPSHKPSQRKYYPIQVANTQHEKWEAVVTSIMREHRVGRPVLIGTTTVEESEYLSAILKDEGLVHQVLNAKYHQVEAEIVAQAGTQGQIMVATNMAGRGTDIKLSDDVAELGGLHVIICQYSRSRRIDRQLAGRCARQGDPGSEETIIALDDEKILAYCSPVLSWLVLILEKWSHTLSHKLSVVLAKKAQRAMERADYRQRMMVMKIDALQHKRLAFTGKNQ
jgi:preprotein translocase subunit SecA